MRAECHYERMHNCPETKIQDGDLIYFADAESVSSGVVQDLIHDSWDRYNDD
jgi:hypothetical protein